MTDNERIEKVKEKYRNNSTFKDIKVFTNELGFTDENDMLLFLEKNDFLIYIENYGIDDKYLIITKNEYYILHHLCEEKMREFGVNELNHELGISNKEITNCINRLYEIKLLKKIEENKEIYITKINYTDISLYDIKIEKRMHNNYLSKLSKQRNKRNIEKYSPLELKELKDIINFNQKISKNIIYGFIILLIIGIILITNKSFKLGIISIVLSIIFYFTKYMYSSKDINKKISELENELELKEINSNIIELRAEKLFKSHQMELSSYYDGILNQSKMIFGVGVICLIIGFVFIGLVIGMIFYSNDTKSIKDTQQIILAVVGGIAGILSNFIAVIFLKMYSKTISSLNSFHSRLVNTHHLHFGNLLLSKIKNDNLREKALSEIFKDWKNKEDNQ